MAETSKQRGQKKTRRLETSVESNNAGLRSHAKKLWTLFLEAMGSHPHSPSKGVT